MGLPQGPRLMAWTTKSQFGEITTPLGCRALLGSVKDFSPVPPCLQFIIFLGQNKHPESDLYETDVTYDGLQEMMSKCDKGDMEADVLIVFEFIRFMMTKWGAQLDTRDNDVKSSVMGKRETVIHAQTRYYF